MSNEVIEKKKDISGLHLLNRLINNNTQLGKQLSNARKLTLRQYLADLIPNENQYGRVNKHLQKCTLAIAESLEYTKCSNIDYVCENFIKRPVIQQADHSNLLLDEEVLLNNILFAIACRENNIDTMITSQCSTVVCLSKRVPLFGPVFLRTHGCLFNVFSLSKSMYKQSNFCALKGPLSIKPSMIFGKPDVFNNTMLKVLIGECADNAPNLYQKCNNIIWSYFDKNVTISRVGLDESMTSFLAARQIEDKYSPVYRLIFDASVRDCFLSIKKVMIKSPENISVNRSYPDFFGFAKVLG